MKKLTSIIIILLISFYTFAGQRDNEIVAESREADKLLDKTIQELIVRVKEMHEGYPMLNELLAEIDESQKAWLEFRRKETMLVGHIYHNGGSGRAQTLWYIKLTRDRIKHIESLYVSR